MQDVLEKLDELKQLTLLSGKNVLNFDDVLLLTGFSRGHLYRLTSQNKIPYYKPFGKDVFFKREEIENWLTQNRVCTVDEAELIASKHTISNPL